MNKQYKSDIKYLKIALLIAGESYCNKKKVGCVIVNPETNSIVSDGFNGTLPGHSNICQDSSGKTLDSVIHAERNALMKICKSTQSSNGCTMYITWSPCQICSTLIIIAGIKRVVYLEEYRKKEGVNLLKKSGIIVDFIEIT